MKIELKEILIKDVAKNYVDSAEEGVVGYDGKLNIRPKYQREFVYDEKKRNAVIDTIRKGFPLNVMYWVKNEDGTLSIAGQILTADEFELRLVLKEGLQGQALPDNTAVVQLDVEIVPELEKEGIARDFVRMIQSLRKEKGFDVSDRIMLSYETASSLVKEAIIEHETYIKDQVLAIEIKPSSGSLYKMEELGDSSISFDVSKN